VRDWLPQLLAQEHNGEGLKDFIQGWTGPLFLGGIGAAALVVGFFGEGGASKVLKLGGVGLIVAIFIFKPEALVALGTFLSGLI
jgi:hypothetical protein